MSRSVDTGVEKVGPRFADYAWQGFEPLSAIETLLRSDEAFFAEKEIVFAALSAWIVDPSNDRLRKLAISRRVAAQTIALEADQPIEFSGALGNVTRHIQQLDEPGVAAFYEYVYFPIGGLKTILSTHPSSQFHEELNSASGSVSAAIRILAIYHFHVNNFYDQNLYYPPSLNKAAKLLSNGFDQRPLRGEGGGNADNIKKQWRKCRSAISFSYAASEISIGANYTDLLDAMQQGRASWEKHGKFLTKLLDRACYVEEEILPKCYKNEGTSLPIASLPNVVSRSFKQREFSAEEKQNAHLEFARQPGVKHLP